MDRLAFVGTLPRNKTILIRLVPQAEFTVLRFTGTGVGVSLVGVDVDGEAQMVPGQSIPLRRWLDAPVDWKTCPKLKTITLAFRNRTDRLRRVGGTLAGRAKGR